MITAHIPKTFVYFSFNKELSITPPPTIKIYKYIHFVQTFFLYLSHFHYKFITFYVGTKQKHKNIMQITSWVCWFYKTRLSRLFRIKFATFFKYITLMYIWGLRINPCKMFYKLQMQLICKVLIAIYLFCERTYRKKAFLNATKYLKRWDDVFDTY